MTDTPRILGMVHLPALPGAPTWDGDREALRARTLDDARTLAAGGVDAVVVENFGDVPYHPETVPRHVVASMTRLVAEVRRTVDVPVGVNVLRNDGPGAVAVAAAAGASFVRVNVHVGARVTDQGVLEGQAHETARLRDRLDADVDVFADVAVKHSAPLGEQRPIAQGVEEAVGRGLADAVVVSGTRTGDPPSRERLDAAAERCAERGVPLFVGSGVTTETVGDYLGVADGVIVGTALKRGGETTAPVEPGRVQALVAAADDADL